MTRLMPQRWARAAIAALSITALAVISMAPSTLAGFTSQIRNTTGTAATTTMLYTHTYNATSCSSNPGAGSITNSIQNIACPSSVYPTSSVGSLADTITANGAISAARVTQQAAIASCGVVRMDNSATSSDLMLPRGNVTFQQGGPTSLSGSSSIGLDGTNAYASNITAASTAALLGGSSSNGIWFKVANGYSAGGVLMGYGTSPSNGSQTNYDHILYMNTAGKIGFGLTGTLGLTATGTSAAAYNDGNWHFAMLVVGALNTTLYVDSTSTSVLSLSALTGYTGYWHIGWDQNGTTSNKWAAGIAQYLQGSLSNAVVFNTALSSANVASLFAQTTQAGWNSAVSGGVATAISSWRLNDTGTTVVATGTSLPTITTTNPCSYVDITWGFTTPTSCVVAPASTTAACTVSTTKLSTFATGSFVTVATPTTSQTATITLAKDATYTGATTIEYLTNLIVYAPVSYRYYLGAGVNSTGWNQTFSWTNAKTPGIAGSTFLL
ncbi:MAG: LamG domain-containing protein [Nocardiaceae bacterium]|nr:LamG domain-containing protein [Nocardiaceae bacterium]